MKKNSGLKVIDRKLKIELISALIEREEMSRAMDAAKINFFPSLFMIKISKPVLDYVYSIKRVHQYLLAKNNNPFNKEIIRILHSFLGPNLFKRF